MSGESKWQALDADKVTERGGRVIDEGRAWSRDGIISQRGGEIDTQMIDYGGILAAALDTPVTVQDGKDALGAVRQIAGTDTDAEAARRCIAAVAAMLRGGQL